MSASTVAVEVPGACYEVVIGPGVLVEVGSRVRASVSGERIAVITDANVAERYLPTVLRSLAEVGLSAHVISVPAGESSKNWTRAGEILESLAAAGLDRTDAVVALGGGVVGDLAGFCAATYLRGVAFVQLPTTLLAQVDSSVGGKTGVDLKAGKNLAGAFKQPLAVLADIDCLTSLSGVEWASGLAEVAKVAILESEERLAQTESDVRALSAREPDAVQRAVLAAVAFKARVVAADERESGLRECLNYGHTLGHAIEKVAGYGVVPHGVAVAEGIRFAARLAVDACGAAAEFCERQERLLDDLGIPRAAVPLGAEELRAAMSSDKKARGGVPRFVLLRAPGDLLLGPVDEDLLERHLRRYVACLDERG